MSQRKKVSGDTPSLVKFLVGDFPNIAEQEGWVELNNWRTIVASKPLLPKPYFIDAEVLKLKMPQIEALVSGAQNETYVRVNNAERLPQGKHDVVVQNEWGHKEDLYKILFEIISDKGDKTKLSERVSRMSLITILKFMISTLRNKHNLKLLEQIDSVMFKADAKIIADLLIHNIKPEFGHKFFRYSFPKKADKANED